MRFTETFKCHTIVTFVTSRVSDVILNLTWRNTQNGRQVICNAFRENS